MRVPDADGRSATQRAILAYLATFKQPTGGRIGHLPRIDDIIDMLNMRHTQAVYDKIGKSLAGLRKRGEVEVLFGPVEKYGKGGRWCLKAGFKPKPLKVRFSSDEAKSQQTRTWINDDSNNDRTQ